MKKLKLKLKPKATKSKKKARNMVVSKNTCRPNSPSGEEGLRADTEKPERQGQKAGNVCIYYQSD